MGSFLQQNGAKLFVVGTSASLVGLILHVFSVIIYRWLFFEPVYLVP